MPRKTDLSAEQEFLQFLVSTLDQHFPRDEKDAHEVLEPMLDGRRFYDAIYASWRVTRQASAGGAVLMFPQQAAASRREYLRKQASICLPQMAAAASGESVVRQLTTRDGESVGTVSCVDSNDGGAFYLVFRFDRSVSWGDATLVVLSKGVGEVSVDVNIPTKEPNVATLQLVLDRLVHGALYEALREASAEAFIVEAL